ncbi:MAG: PP2C family protein-serine/threonine phosphatase [Acidobacteriota bacterium]|nr:PP2C family protein-serine/threonine phosphatase [Acidobacteriota bacterium]
MRHKWLAPALLCAVAALWLAWASPRLHPAARLGLAFDRQGYLDRAGEVAARNGVEIAGWRGYAQLNTLRKNQELQRRMPGNRTAAAFPDIEVETNSLPPERGRGAKVTLRVDGAPLNWRLPVPAKPSSADPPAQIARRALQQIAGADAGSFVPQGEPLSDSDGLIYKWKRTDQGADVPAMLVEITVRNGRAWRAATTFRYPDMPGAVSALTTFRVTASVVWWVLLVVATVVPLLREGGGAAARALKDSSAIRLSIAASVIFTTAAIVEWDDEMISLNVATGSSLEFSSLLLGAVLIGLMFYLMSAATALNGRVHAPAVRGFRLLGTRACFSRTTAAEVFGGCLAAPFLAGLPLMMAAIFHAPDFRTYDDSFPLVRWPVLDAFANAAAQETIGVVALIGVLIPLAIRWRRPGWLRWVGMGALAIMTYSMLNAPFRVSEIANVAAAVMNGLTVLWLYSRFGMLGAIAGHCSSRILSSGLVLTMQPAAGLHAAGWEILAALIAIAGFCALTAARGPEAVADLYGESSTRMQSRSRREELLAEFNVARNAQQRMLPAKPPSLEGYTISASCQPAREVGGDLYDFVQLRDGRWGIGVADVSGKGVPASLYMTLTKGLLCAAAQESDDPKEILGAVNKHLRTVTKRKMFVTMAMGVLDPAAGRMEYVRAGHNPAVWRKAGGETRLLTGHGIGLGIAGPVLFAKTLTAEVLELTPGDALVFYSDGLTEAMNADLEQFGEDRLIAAVESTDGMRAADTRDSILREVREFLGGGHPQDDLTIAVLRVNAAFNGADSDGGR